MWGSCNVSDVWRESRQWVNITLWIPKDSLISLKVLPARYWCHILNMIAMGLCWVFTTVQSSNAAELRLTSNWRFELWGEEIQKQNAPFRHCLPQPFSICWIWEGLVCISNRQLVQGLPSSPRDIGMGHQPPTPISVVEWRYNICLQNEAELKFKEAEYGNTQGRYNTSKL